MSVQRISAAVMSLAIATTAMPMTVLAEVYVEKFQSNELLIQKVVVSDEPSEYGFAEINVIDENGEVVVDDQSDEIDVLQADAQESYAASLPSSFDIRNQGFSVLSRDQGDDGACWAFATVAAAETWAFLNGYEGLDVDFSEAQLTWFAGKPKVNSTDDGINVTDPYESGGNWMRSTGTLTRWTGIVDEENAPFPVYNTSNYELSENQRYMSQYHIKDTLYFDNNDKSGIKNAIMSNGGVQVAYYSDNSYYSSDDKSYYNPAPPQSNEMLMINHAVYIVGWDDNYSSTKFGTSKPSSNGAWLVRGSWGDFGDNGYYWISYQEPELCDFVSYTFRPANELDNNYNYNQSIATGINIASFRNSSDAYIANVFTAKGSEQLKSVSFYTYQDDSEYLSNVSYQIDVYKNVQFNSDSPINGSSVSTTTGTVGYRGMYTIDLSKAVDLSAGENFSVVVKLSHPDKACFCFEGSDSYMKSNSGESYYSADGVTWSANGSSLNNNLINAYTVNKGAVDKSALRNAINTYSSNNNLTHLIAQATTLCDDSNASVADVNNMIALLKTENENINGNTYISTVSQWNAFANSVSNGNEYRGKTIKLTNNIDFSGASFVVAGKYNKEFCGIFDGQGFTMKNITANATYCGIFGGLFSGAVIKNLNVTNAKFSGSWIGGISSHAMYSSVINCGFNGSINATTLGGGLVGYSVLSDISSCYANVTSSGSASINYALVHTIDEEDTGSRFVNCYYISSLRSSYGTKITSVANLVKALNTHNGAQADSGKWVASGNTVVLSENDEDDFYLMSNVSVSGISSKTYTGSAITQPSAVLIYNSKRLVQGTDYTVSYSKNTNVGTATVTFTGKGDYLGSISKTFTIRKISVSSLTVSFKTADQIYTGSEIKPAVTAKFGSKVLKSGTDYDLKYTSNKAIGKATVTITFKGNYSGTKSANFKIVPKTPVVKANYSAVTDAVRINWNKVDDCTGYRIYRYNPTKKTYTSLTTIKNNNTFTYRDSNRAAGTQYTYKVKAYKKVNGVNYWGSASAAKNVATTPKTVKIKSTTTSTGAARLNWNKVTCDGYQIYRYNTSSKTYVKVGTVTSSSTLTYKQTGLAKNTTYKYKVRPYKKDKSGGYRYGAFTGVKTVKTKAK